MQIRATLVSILISQTVAFGQQALFVIPGGVVVYSENTISTTTGKLSKDESTLEYNGKRYPNFGPLFDRMVHDNFNKFDALTHIKLRNKKIIFDGKHIDVGVEIIQINTALFWNDLIACIGTIPHLTTHWWEPSTSKALIIFSPKTTLGAYKGLYLGDKAPCKLWLLDPIENYPSTNYPPRKRTQGKGARATDSKSQN